MNKWQFFSGVLFLLLNSCVANDKSCGQFLADYITNSNAKSGNFEALMRQLVPEIQTRNAGKSCGSAANFVHYLMHQKNISEIKNSSQLIEDILFLEKFTGFHFQSKEELNQILHNEFLQKKEDDARRTVTCYFQQEFRHNGSTYNFPGYNHIFVIEKGGKDEFRLWQAWVQHYSILEWVQGHIEGETEPKDTTYTHREHPLSREEAEHLISNLVMFSDSNLDWNEREQLSAKMFWSTKNLFKFNSQFQYFDSNGNVSRIPSCDNTASTAFSKLDENIQSYLDKPNNVKYIEERRNASIYNLPESNKDWLLGCDENIFSATYASIVNTHKKCYSDISKNIDLSKVPNLPKVDVAIHCEVTTNPNNGAQCFRHLKHVYKLLSEKS